MEFAVSVAARRIWKFLSNLLQKGHCLVAEDMFGR